MSRMLWYGPDRETAVETTTDTRSESTASRLRGGFEQWIDRLAGFEQAPASTVSELRDKIAAQTFDLVVAGQFKRGKSSVINALLGADLLPVGVVPLTSVITILRYGDAAAAQVVFDDGQHKEIAIDDLREYVTERGNPKNAKGVAEVLVTYPATWLRVGIRLIDTPGVGSIYEHNTDVASRFLPKADAVLLVLSVEQPLSAEERDFIECIGEHAGKTFFLLNKTDLLEATDLHDSLQFTRQAIAEAIGKDIALYAISARLALQATPGRPDTQMARSGFPALRLALDEFLQLERGAVLHDSIERRLLRLVAQIRTSVELERSSLTTPLDDLQRKIERFETKIREVKDARDDSVVLLGKEAVDAWMRRLDDDLASLRTGLNEQLANGIARAIVDNGALSTRRLSAVLEKATIAQIRAGFDAWRNDQDRRLKKEFAAWCARHARQIDDSVDELFRFSSELFAIAYNAIRADAAWTIKSGFYYKFWSEPPSMRQLATALVLLLPRSIGHRVLQDRFLAFAHESIETQSGRTRHDFLQRLQASVRDFRRELIDRIDTAIGSIEAAIRKGTTLREVGTQDAADRLGVLDAQLGRLARLDAEIRAGGESWN